MGFLTKYLIRSSRRDDRGVTGVEYALVISLMLVGSTATFEMMDDGIQEHYNDTAEDIGQKDLAAFDVTTTTSGVSSSSTTTTPAYGTSTTTTTAAPTSTTAPTTTSTTTTTTTTTTAAPTTTTTAAAATTTTAAPDELAETLWKDRTSYNNGWVAKARIRLEDQNGDRIQNASVSVTFTLADGTTATATGTTNDFGNVTFKWKNLSSSDFEVVVTIESIVGEGGTTYAPSIMSFSLDT